MKTIYLAIIAAIQANATDIVHIDLDRDQLHNPNEDSFDRPAVLITFRDIVWTSGGQRQQTGMAQIDIKVIRDSIADSEAGSSNQDDALAFLDLSDEVHTALQGLTGEGFSPLSRIRSDYGTTIRSENVSLMTYTTMITQDVTPNYLYAKDTTAAVAIGGIPAPPAPEQTFIIP